MHPSTRDRAIVAMARTGMTYEEIGATFGLTRERIRQILNKAGITGSTTRGALAAAKREALAADRGRILEWAKQKPGLAVRDAATGLDLTEAVSEASARTKRTDFDHLDDRL